MVTLVIVTTLWCLCGDTVVPLCDSMAAAVTGDIVVTGDAVVTLQLLCSD